MGLRFALNWDLDYGRGQKIMLNAQIFGYADARRVLRDAIARNDGNSLAGWIDNHDARLVNGPHTSKDGRLHMTVLCSTAKNYKEGYHIYVSPAGAVSGVNRAVTGIKGHALDDNMAPLITHSNQL